MFGGFKKASFFCKGTERVVPRFVRGAALGHFVFLVGAIGRE